MLNITLNPSEDDYLFLDHHLHICLMVKTFVNRTELGTCPEECAIFAVYRLCLRYEAI